MWFLALELWPYLIGALAIGLVTGWFGGCAPAARTKSADAGDEDAGAEGVR